MIRKILQLRETEKKQIEQRARRFNLCNEIKCHKLNRFVISLWTLSLLCFSTLKIYADSSIEESFSDDIVVELREPIYENGILSTTKGGIITGENIRIQALNIHYVRKVEENTVSAWVEAEGSLMVEYGPYLFVGDSLHYNFDTKTGYVTNGRTGVDPWFFGGTKIHLLPDGSYLLDDAYATTSENYKAEWSITAKSARVRDYKFLDAKNVFFRLVKMPFFWVPKLNLKLDSLFDAPIRYTARWGGRKGPRIGVVYDLYSGENLNAYLRLDYRLNRGFGGGLETDYLSTSHRTHFQTINYFANDTSLTDPSYNKRYRLQGLYDSTTYNEKTTFNISYDKLSDRNMATDYHDRGLELDTAKRTQLHIRHEERNWITNFLTRVRLNSFQTVKQELPTIEATIRPFIISGTGVIADSRFKASYLDFEYNKYQTNVDDYNSIRVEVSQTLYRPFCWGPIQSQAEVGGLVIFYGNNSDEYSRWLTLGIGRYDVHTDLNRSYSRCKHVVSPYLTYEYLTYPSTSPDDHHIFDIHDGWFKLNQLRIGTRQHFYVKEWDGCIHRRFFADAWVNAFFDTSTIPDIVPKLYGKLVYYPTERIRHSISTAWDFTNDIVDHMNFRMDWTINTDAAVSFEYRHRSAYDWRKVDAENFILDSFHSLEDLRDSNVSDRRDTLLLSFFYRFHPEWALECESRNGWNREEEPKFFEYQINLLATLRSAWLLRLSYRHKEDEDRFSFNLSIGFKRPKEHHYPVPCAEL